MKCLDGYTEVFAILGSPVKHTLSPHMYNPLFARIGRNAAYVAFEVGEEALRDAIAGVRALGIRGLHLTCPHKEAVIPSLDRLSREARSIGAVNVVLNDGGRLYGDNTDGRGYLRSLRSEHRYQPEGGRVGLFGAGGSARAIAFTLARVGVSRIDIFNRTRSRALRLAADLRRHHPRTECRVFPLDGDAFGRACIDLDLLVNATTPADDNPVDWRMPLDTLPEHVICSDINYFRKPAPLLERASRRGLRIHDGLGMLIHQGAISMMLLARIHVSGEELGRCLEEGLRSGRAVEASPLASLRQSGR